MSRRKNIIIEEDNTEIEQIKKFNKCIYATCNKIPLFNVASLILYYIILFTFV